MFSDQLKEMTMPAHQAVERRLVGHIKNISSADQYISLLRMMYGYHKPLEILLQPYVQHDVRGRDADNILLDIAHFRPGYQPEFNYCSDLPEVIDNASALGCLYVAEGSTLGGVHIANMISKKLGTDTSNGFRFFHAYGDRTREMWEQFRALLNEPRTDDEKERIQQAASDTFATLNNWIKSNEPAITG